MKHVIRYVKPHLPTMAYGFTIKFTGTIMELLIPYILSYIIDEITPKNDISLVIKWGLLMIVCAAMVFICNVWANRVAAGVSRDTIEKLRYDLFHKISYLSSSQVDHFTIPSLVTRMTTDTYNLHRSLNMVQRMGVRAPILMLGGIVVTMLIDPYLSGILCVLIPFMSVIVAYISKKSIPMFSQAQRSADDMIRVVRENTTGVRVIKALSRSEHEMDRYDTVNKKLNKDEATASITMAAVSPLINLLLNVGLVGVIIVGSLRVASGAMKPGAIVAFLTYFTIILNAIMAVSRMVTMFSKAIASGDRVAEVLLTPADMRVNEWNSDIADEKLSSDAPHIEFDHVSFSYNKRVKNLDNINFSLKQGQSLGIIGPTGSGKSTLAQLLLRLYDIDEGQIRINGRDISTLPLQELRKKFGVVFQNDMLFKDTIHHNIDMGRNLTTEALTQAMEVAQATPFVAESGGLEHDLAIKGANLSGGQKQRLLISRALAGRPEILILDDSSSALDYKTDARFRNALDEHFNEITTIIIAQRISSIMHCDQILVLEEGLPLGLGTHEELMASCDAYREISEIQMGGGEA
ncbi:MAG: ABC transporter ATP-binding protein [Lachnospiraceae bacterium]|nr:ABC transporter ATP-binding protein [Lachnospiraceae bacterium]